MNYKEFVTWFLLKVATHPAVASVASGTEYDVNVDGNALYPQVFVETITTSKREFNNRSEYTFAFVVFEKYNTKKQLTNEETRETIDTILGTTENIGDQIIFGINALAEGAGPLDNRIFFGEEYTALNFENYTDDVTAGWRFEVTAIVDKDLNRCETYIS